MLIGKRPPLVKEIGRAPGQREDRYAHLLSGDVAAAPVATAAATPAPSLSSIAELEARIGSLEKQVAQLAERLEALGG